MAIESTKQINFENLKLKAFSRGGYQSSKFDIVIKSSISPSNIV